MITKASPVLLLIDIQKGFDEYDYWGSDRNNPYAEQNAGELLSFWRNHAFPIIHVKHCSISPLSPLHVSHSGNQFNAFVAPLEGEPIIEKSVNSAFIGTNLSEQLAELHCKTLVIAGLTTDHCVSTTVRMASNLGFNTILIHDATATFGKTGIDNQYLSADLIHHTALASLKDEFAHIMSTDEAIFYFNDSNF